MAAFCPTQAIVIGIARVLPPISVAVKTETHCVEDVLEQIDG